MEIREWKLEPGREDADATAFFRLVSSL